MEDEFDHLPWSSVRRPPVRDLPGEGRHCDKLWSECVCKWAPGLPPFQGTCVASRPSRLQSLEWALTCDFIVTSYGLRRCLSLGTRLNLKKSLSPWVFVIYWSKYINKAITRCAKHNKSNTQGGIQEVREGLWELDNQIEQIKCRSSFKFNLKQPTYLLLIYLYPVQYLQHFYSKNYC